VCGINGFITQGDRSAEGAIIAAMNHAIVHRGPDEDGFFFENADGYSVEMAMRRLSIIDLSTGQQPIYTDDRQKVIVFNGEIYNYRELRAALEGDGVSFHTRSDTEVIVKLYEKHGPGAFSMLDGMFAFSIYDKTRQTVYIARDFFGEKPLYYVQMGDRFVWASELKSILKALPETPPIDRDGLNLFLQLTYIPAPFTIYEGVKKLEANHFIEFACRHFTFAIHESPHTFRRYGALSKPEALEMTRRLVRESVASRSIADVKLGTFLSGGVDSSIVSLCLAEQAKGKIDTFSIGFEKKSFDETDKSRLVAKLIGSNHHEFVISEKDLAQNRDAILLNFDEPFADSSALATYVVAQKSREFVTVALTGDGGDEVFGGYNKYYMGKLNEKYGRLVPESVHKRFAKALERLLHTSDDSRGQRFKAARLLKAINYEGEFYYNIVSLGFQEKEVRELLQGGCVREDSMRHYKNIVGDRNKTLTDFRNIDRLLSLEGDMLVKVDRTSMLTSLECRAPFLNKELWNFTAQLPEHLLMNGWEKKHILKEAFRSYFPKGFLDRSKRGFGVPVGDWLRSELKPELLSYTERAFVQRQGIFNDGVVEELVGQHLSGKIDNTFRVWTYFCLQKWYTHHYGA
jgi:asparagine synthase (glutamine-hydrolysing)